MRHLTAKLWIVLFSFSLILPSLSTFLPIERIEIDNRRLVPPDLEWENMSDPTTILALLAYIRDASPVRAGLIKAAALIDYELFGDSPAPNAVLVGEDGWLFERETIEGLCAPGSVSPAAKNLIDTVRYLRENGIKAMFTVAPAKFSIHRDHLDPIQAELAACAISNDRDLRDYLLGAGADGYFDSWVLFEAIKAEGLDPYFKTDTHFNYLGSTRWIEMLVSTLDPGIWEQNAVVDRGQIEFIGNLMTLIGLGQRELVSHLVIDRGLPRVASEQLHDRFSDEQTATEHFRAPEEVTLPLIDGRTLMLKDSFMDIPMPSMAQYFRDLTVTDWRSSDSIDFFVQNALSVDLIVIETSEDALINRFRDRSLLEALRTSAGD